MIASAISPQGGKARKDSFSKADRSYIQTL